ncbi:hypothetical protein [Corticicoccus populi]|uniref:Uncharacterized protein n=1 Tax=Corticicoccus populi TaxID=1812821 RepID=A0ABW5WVM2_9STAP
MIKTILPELIFLTAGLLIIIAMWSLMGRPYAAIFAGGFLLVTSLYLSSVMYSEY